jgi:hypothetical protein
MIKLLTLAWQALKSLATSKMMPQTKSEAKDAQVCATSLTEFVDDSITIELNQDEQPAARAIQAMLHVAKRAFLF